MAGETPDTSGQRKSSGTSSGSSSGDRTARSSGEASGEPTAKPADPRLAVSRQSAAEEDAPARVDQPTAVFSTAALDSSSGEAEAGSSAESSEAEAEGAGEADASKDARLRAAVAAWVSGSDGNDDSRPPEDEEAPESAEEPAEEAEEAEGGAEGAEAAAAGAAGGSDASGAADEADSGSGSEAEDEPEDDESEASQDADADPADEDESADGDEAALDAAPEEPAPTSEDDDDPAEDDAPQDDESDDEESEDTKSEDPPADQPADQPVDQPTAIFKAPKAKVDQPTAMLKLPADAEKAEAEKTETSKAEAPKAEAPKADTEDPAAEAESERTSKFVALKPLDEPKAPKQRTESASDAKAPQEAAAGAALPPEAPTAAASAPGAAHLGPERTTQQPLPPKPPLDLLAELTNRPKPPETVLRTTVRRVKIWTPLVLLLVVVFAVVQSVRPLPTPTLALTADAKYTFDGSEPSLPWPTEGQAVVDVDGIGSLGTYGDEKPIPVGSVAKVMTAYLILKEHKATEELTVDKTAADHFRTGEPANESVVEVEEGDVITVEEAIKDLMLPSANNIAKLLARWDSGGDEEAFVKKMNDAAKDLGMKNTTYTDASGLDETTVSTAVDQVKLGKAAMEIPLFRKIVRMPKFDSTTSERPQDERNFNKLVPLFGVVGIKTGSTTKAGGNLLFAAEKEIGGERQLIIGAVFGQHLPPIIDTATARSKDLILRAQDLLETRTVVQKGDVVGHVDDGLGGTTPVVATEDVSAVGWPGLTVDLAVGDGGETVPHIAKAGTEVGVLSVGDGKEGAVKVPVALQEDLKEPGFGAKLTRIG
ncbi:D-alanyl-D-alanine carboxypeptidase [Streptomyces sp. LHD-70]|uniref:D-alanyl-D-alanine carboxypeptidase n=1 Tax=Streptomyces sp. LHD-70 TaxID=3072140 RepID=UPI00280CAF6E|nr:D-alanyl-D-alanine carboxypeptidase [Streptomyces sp. LHD-70]MDQ8704537.1 D-alanyl-D-alanine carboxypeptidase [Streptomyces sp. LHD-70]